MSLGLTKPGASVALRHPKTGAILEPLGFLKNGRAVWPVLGASSDDEDDPAFVGGGGGGGSTRSRVEDDDDEESEDDADTDEDDEDDDKKSSSKKDEKKKDEPTRPERQAARYRTQRNELQRQLDELKAEQRKVADAGKPADELMKRDLDEVTTRATKLEASNRTLMLENAFLRANDIQWADPEDALKLIDFDEIDIDDDGTVDARQLGRALRALAKRKPHLVKRAKNQDENNDDDEEPGSRSSASQMNGRRKGSQKQGTDRAGLAKRFPVLGR